jgi:SAM-dependent methyltransferase
MAWGYDRDYFMARQRGWSASAEALAAVLLPLFQVRSAVEVGCGTANLLEAFARHGVTDLLGLYGPDDPRDLMRVSDDKLRPWQLDQLAPLERRFDLSCSLEVAEHIPEARAAQFVHLLVEAAPVVLFGAAISGQGGPGHVNERRQSWWAERFAGHGYVAVDCVRPALWGVAGMEWYYPQNILVYCTPDRVPAGHAPVANPLYLNLVATEVMEPLVRGPDSIGSAVRALRRDSRALAQALRRRLAGGARVTGHHGDRANG